MGPAKPQTLHFIHPGPIARTSGGTIYDRHVIDGLRRIGWQVDLHELPGRFPLADDVAEHAVAALLDALPGRALAVVDGLALPAFDGAAQRHAGRLRLTGMVHHPTADETGLDDDQAAELFAIERRIFALLSRIIVPSSAMARRLADFGVPSDRVYVAAPGVEPAPRSLGSDGGPVQLLCVASLTPRKGHVALLEALADCRDLDWRLVCAGPPDPDSDTQDQVEAALTRLGLAGRVRLVGAQVGAALELLYAAADVFALATRYEGYGIVFAEAMAHGLPIVATGAGAVADTVPNAAGTLVPLDDRAALAGALRRMIGDAAFRRAKAEGAWRAGQSLPRWTDTAAAFAHALTEP